MNITGTNLADKTQTQFGNFSFNKQFTPDNSSSGYLTLIPFVNISITDNTTTYGDNRAVIEVGNQEVGFSRDEITYNYQDNFKIYSMYPLLVSYTGQLLTIYGSGFLDLPTLNCKFGNLLAQNATYFNSTKIQCFSPNITDRSVSYPVSVTLNGYEYINFTNPSNKETKTL